MVWRWRAIIALPEDPGSIPSTHMVLTATCNPNSQWFNAFSWPPDIAHMGSTDTYASKQKTHTHHFSFLVAQQWWHTPSIPVLERQSQTDLCESSRSAWFISLFPQQPRLHGEKTCLKKNIYTYYHYYFNVYEFFTSMYAPRGQRRASEALGLERQSDGSQHVGSWNWAGPLGEQVFIIIWAISPVPKVLSTLKKKKNSMHQVW